MTDFRNRDAPSEPHIHVTAKGRRYVKPDDMFDDPAVRDRLKKANDVATRLGIKGHV